jgi:hypothetical protein
MQNPGDPWAKILTTIQILFLKIVWENILKKFNSPLCDPFSLHTTMLHPNAIKLKGRLLKNEPWPLRGFLHDLPFQV